jgi:hypothetical protein
MLGDVLRAAQRLEEIPDLPGLGRDLSRGILGTAVSAVVELSPNGPASEFFGMLGQHLMAQATCDMVRGRSAGGAPRPEAEGAGAARSEETSTKFPVAKKT